MKAPICSGERTRLACPFRRPAEMIFASSVASKEAIGGAPIAAREAGALPGNTKAPPVI
jgi:hypothetical protein